VVAVELLHYLMRVRIIRVDQIPSSSLISMVFLVVRLSIYARTAYLLNLLLLPVLLVPLGRLVLREIPVPLVLLAALDLLVALGLPVLLGLQDRRDQKEHQEL
jgi:hypothetical protein